MCRMKKGILSILSAVLAAAFFVASAEITAYADDAVASAMDMEKIEGTVKVADGKGKTVPARANMKLYSGYIIDTMEKSYAWINLDSSKLIKLDALSQAGIIKNGKKLEVLLMSGALFFDVDKPLEDDESLNIRTSTMAVGIRGTSGWVRVLDTRSVAVYILEGTVEVTAANLVTGEVKTDTVSGGERARCVSYSQIMPGGVQRLISSRLNMQLMM